MIREYIVKISDEILEDEFDEPKPIELVRCRNCKYAFFKEELVAVGHGFAQNQERNEVRR